VHARNATGTQLNRDVRNIKMKNSSLSIFIILFVGLMPFTTFHAVANGDQNSKYKRTGTFSDLEYHEGPGDITGVEIRIVETNGGYQGTVQIAEGGPG
jgi:hypothetical protein